MKNIYEKPIVLANEELAEGVYAASGAQQATGGVAVSEVKLKTPGNEYYKVNVYTVTIRNSGNEDAEDWQVAVSVTSGTATNAKVDNNWLASASLNGDTITIVPGGGGAISAGGSLDVDVVVSFSSNSITLG